VLLLARPRMLPRPRLKGADSTRSADRVQGQDALVTGCARRVLLYLLAVADLER
jgi:hypothetical protein